MLPDQKASLIGELQAMGIYAGFTGDGANDCGALKAAMVGVSLSESEASIAAPFTYQRPNIECVPALLSEGRSSLVTSFQLFRYISMYSLTQFGAAILTYFVGSVLGNWQYLYQDLIIVFPLTIFMGATAANRQLSVKRPSAQLTSATNIAGLAGHVVIILAFQVFVFLYTQKQPGYYLPDNPRNTPDAFETTALYYYSNFPVPHHRCPLRPRTAVQGVAAVQLPSHGLVAADDPHQPSTAPRQHDVGLLEERRQGPVGDVEEGNAARRTRQRIRVGHVGAALVPGYRQRSEGAEEEGDGRQGRQLVRKEQGHQRAQCEGVLRAAGGVSRATGMAARETRELWETTTNEGSTMRYERTAPSQGDPTTVH